MIDYEKFQMSLKRLQEQHDNYRTLDTDLPEIIQEGIAESVIQRFETCYDCLWKILKRYMIDELAIPDIPNSPKPVFRKAFENNMFTSPIEQWLTYADRRTATAHDYSGEKAQNCLAIMQDFIEDAIGLYQTMTSETWR